MTGLAAQILTLAAAALAAGLVVVMWLIGRFYERTSQERSAYRWFALPALLLLAAGARYALVGGGPAGDPLGDLLRFVAGTALLTLCLFLYRLMTGRKR